VPDEIGGAESEDAQKRAALESLARILETGFATASERQKSLIQHLVTEEIAGRGAQLKAVSIAIDVLGRSEDFDPQTDSIVRVEMGRLRQALDLYYATRGTNDPLRIKFEKGSYRPKFEWVSKEQPGRTKRRLRVVAVVLVTLAGAALLLWPISKALFERQAAPGHMRGPSVAVAPFTFSSDKTGWDYLAAGMQGELVGILAEFDWLTVFPILTNQSIDKAISSLTGRVDYIVRGSAQVAQENLTIWLLLTDGKTGAVLWSNRYDTRLEASGLFELQRDMAVRIASDIGNPRGIIASLGKTRLADDSFRSAAGFDYYLRALQFFNTFDRADYRDAHSCAETASSAGRKDPNALALFALLELAGNVFGYDRLPLPERRAKAVKLAEESYRLNERGTLPRIVSCIAAIGDGNEEWFRKIAELSLRDFPNNPVLLLDLAQRFILGTSDWSEGVLLLERAHKLSPITNSSYGVLSAFTAFRRGDNNQTILDAMRSSWGTLSPSLQVIEMALRAHAGDQRGAERLRQSLQALGFRSGAICSI
jgi:TolB-like protein